MNAPSPTLTMPSPDALVDTEIAARFGLRVLGTDACPECGQACERFQVFGVIQHDCRACNEARTARRRHDERRAECLRTWLDVTPAGMQTPIVEERLAPYLRPALKLDGTAGAGFAGVTGGGKTRVAFHLLKLAAARGSRPFAVSASRYRQAAADRHDNSQPIRQEARAILENARHAGTLLLDDIGKGASTPAGDEALYELLDHRRNHHRLTFWTANGSATWLQRKLGADFGPAIVRRLIDLAGWTAPGTGRLYAPEHAAPANPN
jgi:hypothetical protein